MHLSENKSMALKFAALALFALVGHGQSHAQVTQNVPTTCTQNGNELVCTTKFLLPTNATISAANTSSQLPINCATAPCPSPSVGNQSQTITVTSMTSTQIQATASSQLPVAYSSNTPNICSVGSSTGAITVLATGTCTIAVNQAGNNQFAAAPTVTQSLNVTAATLLQQTITFNPSLTGVAGGTQTLSASAPGGTVTFAASPSTVCTVSGTILSYVAAGACSVVASQSGGNGYAAAPNETRNITVSAAPTNVACPAGEPRLTVDWLSTTPFASSNTATRQFSYANMLSRVFVIRINIADGLNSSALQYLPALDFNNDDTAPFSSRKVTLSPSCSDTDPRAIVLDPGSHGSGSGFITSPQDPRRSQYLHGAADFSVSPIWYMIIRDLNCPSGENCSISGKFYNFRF